MQFYKRIYMSSCDYVILIPENQDKHEFVENINEYYKAFHRKVVDNFLPELLAAWNHDLDALIDDLELLEQKMAPNKQVYEQANPKLQPTISRKISAEYNRQIRDKIKFTFDLMQANASKFKDVTYPDVNNYVKKYKGHWKRIPQIIEKLKELKKLIQTPKWKKMFTVLSMPEDINEEVINETWDDFTNRYYPDTPIVIYKDSSQKYELYSSFEDDAFVLDEYFDY